MQVLEDLAGVQLNGATVLTFGAFDGVHLGHQQVIERVKRKATETGCQKVVLSFYPHPKRFLDPANCPPSLTVRDKKVALVQELGVDYLLLVRLETWLSQMRPREFIETVVCRQLGAQHVVIGYDSEFGYRRQGNAQVLQQMASALGITVDVVPAQSVGGEIISSTRIREAIETGDLKLAACMLGRRYSILGEIVVGQRIGRQIGFPTANLQIEDQTLPPRGVYAVYAHLHGTVYEAVLNIGLRPTFDGMHLQVEAHLLDFDEDIYGETLELEFVQCLRTERRFDSQGALIAQIERDITVARSLLTR